jgi:hypothetical protein
VPAENQAGEGKKTRQTVGKKKRGTVTKEGAVKKEEIQMESSFFLDEKTAVALVAPPRRSSRKKTTRVLKEKNEKRGVPLHSAFYMFS